MDSEWEDVLEDGPVGKLDDEELRQQIRVRRSLNGNRSAEHDPRLLELWAEDTRRTGARLRGEPTAQEREQTTQAVSELTVVTAEEFAAVDEAGAEPIVGEGGEILIPENGDVMFYGNGGAAKTTLSVDLAFHMTTGDRVARILGP